LEHIEERMKIFDKQFGYINDRIDNTKNRTENTKDRSQNIHTRIENIIDSNSNNFGHTDFIAYVLVSALPLFLSRPNRDAENRIPKTKSQAKKKLK
jgi:hypothetical protein